MDIPLHYFDEYVGDKLYAAVDNPFVRFASPYALNATKSLSSLDFSSTSGFTSSLTSYLATLSGPSQWGRDHVLRQSLSLYAITYVGILLLYFSVATFSYYFIFDHRMMEHPRFLKNQVKKEIDFSLEAFPALDLLTLPWFVGDVRGWSMMYDTIEEGPFGTWGGAWPWLYMLAVSVVFLVFTDFCIYWAHRWLHVPFIYKRLHKPHHKWIIPTPFASHAFHPLDGYIQSVPYHAACYIFPLHKYLFIGLFSFVNLWSIFIHDSDMLCDHPLEHYINGPAHHTLHHMYFTCNYGQYFTWSDKLFKSFRVPAKGDDPLLAVLAAQEKARVASSPSSPSPSSSAAESSSDEGEVAKRAVGVAAPGMKRVDSGIGSEPGSAEASDDEAAAAAAGQGAKKASGAAARPRRDGLRERK
ncbi:hypothetical protein JCM8097_007423 [Rhodosporidiobolus ruineniae]